ILCGQRIPLPHPPQESHSGFFLGGFYLLVASGTNRKKAASEGMQPLHAPGKPFRIFLGGVLFYRFPVKQKGCKQS
ncbi:MAG: hypothetical protein PUE61_12750, partial [Clostridiales bacterium]|nr:hypothetical protein [Clostridiales bacterium]